MAQTETGQQKQRKRQPMQPTAMPMGMHNAKAKPGECRCGRCSFTKHKEITVRSGVKG